KKQKPVNHEAVLANGLLSLRSKYRRVDVHGVPVPDKAPTGEFEQDRLANMAHVDMYSLTPSFAVTDLAVPVEGGELNLELRRVTGVRSRRIFGSDDSNRPITWAPDNVFGMGWDTNLACHAVMCHTADGTFARVIDDVGTILQYGIEGTEFIPETFHSFAADS